MKVISPMYQVKANLRGFLSSTRQNFQNWIDTSCTSDFLYMQNVDFMGKLERSYDQNLDCNLNILLIRFKKCVRIQFKKPITPQQGTKKYVKT